MDCSPETLNAYLDGELSEADRAAVEEHLARCSPCTRELAALRELGRAVDRSYDRDRALIANVRREMQGSWWHRFAAMVSVAAAAALAVVAVLYNQASHRTSPDPSGQRHVRRTPTSDSRRIRTGPGEHTDVDLPGGSKATLFERSELRVDTASGTGPVASLFLSRGAVRIRGAKQADRPAVRVSTKLGTVETLGTEFKVALGYPDGKGGRTMDRKLAVRGAKLMLLVTVFSGQVLVQHADGAEEVVGPETSRAAELPDELVGFRGMLVGKLTSKADASFVVKVEEITRVWKQNEAENPKAAVGKEVAVVINRESKRAEKFLATLKTLTVGDRIEVEPFHLGGDVLTVTEVLRKASELPTGIWGFRGMLRGKVKNKSDDGLLLEVEQVLKVWRGNKATDPKCIVGKEVPVDFERLPKPKHHGTRRPNVLLEVGDRVDVQAFHFGGHTLSVVELLKK
ncbi:MAG: FecR domain-containing protein, partial [Planctomycetota bacterium]